MTLGLFIAPGLSAILACVLGVPLNGAWVYYTLILIGAYIFAIIIGLPAVLFLRMLQWSSLISFLLLFFTLGMVVFALLQIFISMNFHGLEIDGFMIVKNGYITWDGLISVAKNAATLGAFSALAASIFWTISVRKK